MDMIMQMKWKEVFGGDEDITAEFMVEWTE
jgi:hypothetical protein